MVPNFSQGAIITLNNRSFASSWEKCPIAAFSHSSSNRSQMPDNRQKCQDAVNQKFRLLIDRLSHSKMWNEILNWQVWLCFLPGNDSLAEFFSSPWWIKYRYICMCFPHLYFEIFTDLNSPCRNVSFTMNLVYDSLISVCILCYSDNNNRRKTITVGNMVHCLLIVANIYRYYRYYTMLLSLVLYISYMCPFKNTNALSILFFVRNFPKYVFFLECLFSQYMLCIFAHAWIPYILTHLWCSRICLGQEQHFNSLGTEDAFLA